MSVQEQMTKDLTGKGIKVSSITKTIHPPPPPPPPRLIAER